MAGAEIMSSILTEHIQYMSDIKGIPITGFSEDNMNTIMGDTTKTLKEHICTMDNVVSIEMTRDTRYTCKWVVLTKSMHEALVHTKLTQLLSKLHRETEGTTTSRKVGRTRIWDRDRESNSLYTYADILAKRFQTDEGDTRRPELQIGTHSVNVPPTISSPQILSTARKGQAWVSGAKKTAKLHDNVLKLQLAEMETKLTQVVDSINSKQQSFKSEINKTLADTIALDREKAQDTLQKKIDNKLRIFKTDQESELKKMETNIVHTVNTKLDTNVENLSVEVANHVAIKLIELLTGSKSPLPQNIHSSQTLITPHSQMSPIGLLLNQAQQPAENSTDNGNMVGVTPIKQNSHTTQEIEMSPPKCSPHDTHIEQSFVDQ